MQDGGLITSHRLRHSSSPKLATEASSSSRECDGRRQRPRHNICVFVHFGNKYFDLVFRYSFPRFVDLCFSAVRTTSVENWRTLSYSRARNLFCVILG